ncbi:MAG: hypothetical protein ACOYMF_05640 [Bacteroidales bacterium]
MENHIDPLSLVAAVLVIIAFSYLLARLTERKRTQNSKNHVD